MNHPPIVHPEAHVRPVAARDAAARYALKNQTRKHTGDGVSDESDPEEPKRERLRVEGVLGGRGGKGCAGRPIRSTRRGTNQERSGPRST